LRPQQNWAWVLGDGIITLLLGGIIWFQFDAPWLIGRWLGQRSPRAFHVMLSLNACSALNGSDLLTSSLCCGRE